MSNDRRVDPRGQIGLGRGSAQVVSRRAFLSGASALTATLMLPWERRTVAAAPSSRPLLLVHGYNSHAGIWQHEQNAVVRQLLRLGFRWTPESLTSVRYPPKSDQPDLEDTTGDIARAGRWLTDVIVETARRAPSGKIDVLAYSMGGLVARSALENLRPTSTRSGPPVQTAILIAAPNTGVDVLVLARRLQAMGMELLGDLGRELLSAEFADLAVRQMIPDSDLLRALNGSPPPDPRVRLVTVAGALRASIVLQGRELAVPLGDGLISVSSASTIPGAVTRRYTLPADVRVDPASFRSALDESGVLHDQLLRNDDTALVVASELLPSSTELHQRLTARLSAGAIQSV